MNAKKKNACHSSFRTRYCIEKHKKTGKNKKKGHRGIDAQNICRGSPEMCRVRPGVSKETLVQSLTTWSPKQFAWSSPCFVSCSPCGRTGDKEMWAALLLNTDRHTDKQSRLRQTLFWLLVQDGLRALPGPWLLPSLPVIGQSYILMRSPLKKFHDLSKRYWAESDMKIFQKIDPQPDLLWCFFSRA